MVILFDVFKWLNYWGYNKNNNSHNRRISPDERKQIKLNLCFVNSMFCKHPKHITVLAERKLNNYTLLLQLGQKKARL